MPKVGDKPFDSLPLEPGEEIRWEAWTPTFHRFSYYAIVVSDRAVYLYSRLWHSFVRWHRYPLSIIRSAEYVPSWFMPKLVIQLDQTKTTLRMPMDWGIGEQLDQRQLTEAAGMINGAVRRHAAG